ncbi:MAG: hypothetical protein RR341_06220 [Bacteroidales bacterium]
MNNAFCNNCDLSNSIPELVANEILGTEQMNFVRMRYNDMVVNYDKTYQEWQQYFNEYKTELKTFNGYTDTISVIIPITHSYFKDIKEPHGENKVQGAIGVDLPTWFNIDNARKQQRIMFIAQDPLRGNKWYGGNGSVSEEAEKKYPNRVCMDAILSTPFGLHDKEWRSKGNGGGLFCRLIERCVNEGLGVYLTDCRKYFVYDHKTSDNYSKSKREKYVDILRKEIELIRPTLIICVGKSARDLCDDIKDEKIQSLFKGKFPHLSGLGRGAIKKSFEIEGKATNEIVVEAYFKRIQKYIGE